MVGCVDTILPKPGVLPEFDQAEQVISEIEKGLAGVLVKAQQTLGSNKLAYYHPGVSKERYQIAVPASLKSKVPASWVIKSQTKTMFRYWTADIERVQRPLAEACETRAQLMRDMLKQTLLDFDQYSHLWTAAVGCLAEVDCLLSLLTVKNSMGQPMCKPVFVQDRVVFDVKGLRHPCIVHSGLVLVPFSP